jgi:predicted NAD/FAD-dependent oxidoreductase
MRIAVVGAGLAGLSFAHFLHHKAELTLFEKSRGVGGRLATRRSDDYQFDHGAQFFTCRSDILQALIDDKDFSREVSIWSPKVTTLSRGEKPFKRDWFEPHYVGNPSMTSLPKRLAQDVDVQLQTRVEKMSKSDDGWQLFTEAGASLGTFDWVAAAMPAPQTNALFQDQFAHQALIESAVISPCFALMLKLRAAPEFDFDAAVVRESPVAWIANNCSKPGRNAAPSLLIHSSNDWAKEHLEDSQDEIQAALLSALMDLVPLQTSDIADASLHRWRYAKVETEVGEDFLIDESAKLAAIGDWCSGNRAEDAFLSGAALARHMHSLAFAD